jgi:hypothetical protein
MGGEGDACGAFTRLRRDGADARAIFIAPATRHLRAVMQIEEGQGDALASYSIPNLDSRAVTSAPLES